MPIEPPVEALVWMQRQPERLLALLTELGLAVETRDQRHWMHLAGLELEIGAGPDRLVARQPVRSPPALAVDDDPAAARLLALGLASVDPERTFRELAPRTFSVAGSDDALGARAWLDSTSAPPLIVLEASTEARLAAALARHGEGPVALYVAPPRSPGPSHAKRLERLERLGRLEPPRRWPGGAAARLVRPDRPWGPFLFLVADDLLGADEPPATTPPSA